MNVSEADLDLERKYRSSRDENQVTLQWRRERAQAKKNVESLEL